MPAGAGDAASSATQGFNVQSLQRTLRASGAHVAYEQTLRQPFFDAPAAVYLVDGEAIQVFSFRDGAAAARAARTVSPDGSRVGASQPFWIGPPHFFRRGRLLVLYLGEDASILRRLAAVLGEQFAGR